MRSTQPTRRILTLGLICGALAFARPHAQQAAPVEAAAASNHASAAHDQELVAAYRKLDKALLREMEHGSEPELRVMVRASREGRQRLVDRLESHDHGDRPDAILFQSDAFGIVTLKVHREDIDDIVLDPDVTSVSSDGPIRPMPTRAH